MIFTSLSRKKHDSQTCDAAFFVSRDQSSIKLILPPPVCLFHPAFVLERVVGPEKTSGSCSRQLSTALLSQSLLVGKVVVVSQRVVNVVFPDATCVREMSYFAKFVKFANNAIMLLGVQKDFYLGRPSPNVHLSIFGYNRHFYHPRACYRLPFQTHKTCRQSQSLKLMAQTSFR